VLLLLHLPALSMCRLSFVLHRKHPKCSGLSLLTCASMGSTLQCKAHCSKRHRTKTNRKCAPARPVPDPALVPCCYAVSWPSGLTVIDASHSIGNNDLVSFRSNTRNDVYRILLVSLSCLRQYSPTFKLTKSRI
jgi:hypothetical protein